MTKDFQQTIRPVTGDWRLGNSRSGNKKPENQTSKTQQRTCHVTNQLAGENNGGKTETGSKHEHIYKHNNES